MQVFGLQAGVYRGASWASRLAAKTSDIAAVRRDALRRFDLARRHGLTAERAAQAVGVSRASLHRWSKRLEPRSRRPLRVRLANWPHALVRATQRWREEEPAWGRAKIWVKLRDEGFEVSESTVGRILRRLVERGAVHPVAILRRRSGGAVRWTRERRLAHRLPAGFKADEPGRLVQLDTVYVNIAPQKAIKHFTAYDPVAKWTVARAFNRATAQNAAAFLESVRERMPFEVRGIQVDGGSEFMAQFEQACQQKGLILCVLPPKSPQLNGAVERCNGAWRYEFYAVYELPWRIDELNPLIEAFEHRYNHHRPHQALDGLTPAQHLAATTAKNPPPSHMS
jgi:putative transposase